MPIRFRCHRCNQLMGIARRKAGMTVRCPTCHADLVVPQTDEEPAAAPPIVAPPPAAPLFERSDFEAFLESPAREPSPPPAVPPTEGEHPVLPSLELTPERKPSHPPGLVLSPTQATWLTVAAILLLALAFGAGLLVGRYWMG